MRRRIVVFIAIDCFPDKLVYNYIAIQRLDFKALKKAGYKGAAFDKDNCLVGVARVSGIL